ncbi:MAG: DUF262 domain-containing protein [Candidatus Scalindua sp.]|jgi:hypothetical protein|nr:DUF262 domain-containing protein [Candidatus Scalindua sp.]
MDIELNKITIRELVKDYRDNGEGGVIGYGGKLDIRPPYQREFVYDKKKRDAVIDSINKEFPLNVMYWAVRDDGNFEIIDGQQRTISIAQYVEGDFSFDGKFWGNLQDDERDKILDYELMIYWCSGTPSERLEWFEIINIAGERLSDQELRNAVYYGSWVTDAKRYFGRRGCAAYRLANKYVSGDYIRQEYLETTIKWIANTNKADGIKEYMAVHQHQASANELWLYFQSVINWITTIFPTYRSKQMKRKDWGFLYNEFKDKNLDPAKLEKEIKVLMLDDEVGNKNGIYQYVLTRDEKYLNLRSFSDKQKSEAYEKQNGICKICGKHFEIDEMEGDHITPWHEGGKTTAENCQMLCKDDNRRKSGK